MLIRALLVMFVVESVPLLWGQAAPVQPANRIQVFRNQSPEQMLQRHGVPLTRPGITAALRNPEADVRSVAAHVLAEQDAREAIPALEEAFAHEKDPLVRINLAYALAKLGDAKGADTLQDSCRDKSSDAFSRLEAARLTLQVGQESPDCIAAAVEILKTGDSGSRQSAAWLLSNFHDLSGEDTQKISAAALDALQAKQPTVRSAASHLLGVRGGVDAIPGLQKAHDIEQDEFVRAHMESDLKKLQEKQILVPPR